MVYKVDYFGFVYIWFDTKRKKYIIGSHYGSVDSSYTTGTGGKVVQRIFKKRPESMKRRILEYVAVDSLQAVREAEERWLCKRPEIGKNKRYYNVKNKAIGLDSYTATKVNKRRVKEGKHNFTSEHAKKQSRDRIAQGTHHFLHSDFNKKPFRLYRNDKLIGEFDSKEHAKREGIPAHLIDKLRKYGEYTIQRGGYSDRKDFMHKGDKFVYSCCT